MAYELIDLGQGRALQDTTVFIPPIVDEALERAVANPVLLAEQLRLRYGVFPGLLRTMIELHGTEGERQIIAENLAEEDGEGDASQDHRVLYDEFLGSLRASYGEGPPPAMGESASPYTMAVIVGNALRSIVTCQPYATAVATIYGLEHRAPQQMRQLRRFFRELGRPALKLGFFDLHIEGDEEHSQEFKRLLASEIKTPQDLSDAQRGLDMVAVTDQLFWMSIRA